MIRFRNPGTQYTTQVQVFRELYKEYKDAPSFDLDDMAATIAKTKLMTAYGYAGDAALALSNTENDSLNSTPRNNGCQIRRKGSFLQGYIVLIAGFRRDYV